MDTSADSTRSYWLEKIEDVRRKRSALGSESAIAAAFNDGNLTALEQTVKETCDEAIADFRLPLLIAHLSHHELDALFELDGDISAVRNRVSMASGDPSSVSRYLTVDKDDPRGFFSGLFETWCKATLIREGKDVALDSPVPSGRNHDVSAKILGRSIQFECTMLSEDDETRAVWTRFLAAKKDNPQEILIRPGKFCPNNSKGPDPRYMTLRVYGKVFDKIAKNLDPAKSQFAQNVPSLILGSFVGIGVEPRHIGVDSAVEELFSKNRRFPRSPESEDRLDVSLKAWLDHTADEKIRAGKVDACSYERDRSEILAAPRQLSGIVAFDNSQRSWARLNYSAAEEVAVSHAEMARIEEIFAKPAAYFPAGIC